MYSHFSHVCPFITSFPTNYQTELFSTNIWQSNKTSAVPWIERCQEEFPEAGLALLHHPSAGSNSIRSSQFQWSSEQLFWQCHKALHGLADKFSSYLYMKNYDYSEFQSSNSNTSCFTTCLIYNTPARYFKTWDNTSDNIGEVPHSQSTEITGWECHTMGMLTVPP